MPPHFGPQRLTAAPRLTPPTLTRCGIGAPGWAPRRFISVTTGIATLGRETCPSVPLRGSGRSPAWSVEVTSKSALRIVSAFKIAGPRPSWLVLFVVETLCGRPPVIESTEQVWNKSSTPGSTVAYFCKGGFFKDGGHGVSVCSETGQWSVPSLVCTGISDVSASVSVPQCDTKVESSVGKYTNAVILSAVPEISCGNPPMLPHADQLWNGSSTPGSTVSYYCKTGFSHREGTNMSLCTSHGYWTQPSISCKGKTCAIKQKNAFLARDPRPPPHFKRVCQC